jgi:predicted nucleotidyltransferase
MKQSDGLTTMDVVVQEMKSRIVQRFAPLKIILFGSLAADRGDRWSDVDLLIVMPDGTDKRSVAIQIRRTLADVPSSKDIVVTTPDEIRRRGDLIGTVLRPALREGRVLYERG